MALPESDLDLSLEYLTKKEVSLRGARLFLTGGTGFIGKWLVETLLWANDRMGLGLQAVLLTRDPEKFSREYPDLGSHPSIRLHCGDVRDFAFPDGKFSHVIHGATEASVTLNEQSPLVMLDTIVQGTRRTLDFAVAAGADRFLFVSSGAVYGKQPPQVTHLPETYAGAPDTMDHLAAYGEGKRHAEFLCAVYRRRHGLAATIARCFAFVGPYLSLDTHFAIGNFIRDAVNGGPIRVNGDGTPFRSYLYAADLAAWLWKILMDGELGRPYNVGSERDLTIRELAGEVSSALDSNIEIIVARSPTQGQSATRYVPSTERARCELGLIETVSLTEGIRRTAEFYQRGRSKFK